MTGKTTLVQKFAIELAEDMALTKVQESKFFLYVDIAHYKTLNNLWQVRIHELPYLVGFE